MCISKKTLFFLLRQSDNLLSTRIMKIDTSKFNELNVKTACDRKAHGVVNV